MFQNLKIVELASVLAGPMVGRFFSELGAEVIKIENKSTHGDVTRQWKIPSEDKATPISAYYASANYGKQTLLEDVREEKDYSEVLEYIKKADVLIVNFKAGDANKLKLDYEAIKQVNPTIIYAEITGFGECDNRTAFDVVLQAESGFMSINGEKNAQPLKMPVALIDILAAHQLKEGILCALLQRSYSHKGYKVNVSLYDAAISSLANQATNWLMANHLPSTMGSQHPNIAPYGDMFLTQDQKWLVLAVGNDKQFQNLCDVLEIGDDKYDEKFSTNTYRVEHREALNKILAQKFLEKKAVSWQAKLLAKEVPFGIVKNIQEVFEQEEAKKLILEDEIEDVPTRSVKTTVFRISE